MNSFLLKYRRVFAVLSLGLVIVFGLSSVSMAYSSVLCKMKMEQVQETKSCCCKISEEETGMSCSEIPVKNEVRFEKADGCCCVVKQSPVTERNYTPVTTGVTNYNISHEGSLLYELPIPNSIPTLKSISFQDIKKSDGRSVLTLNSVLRI